MRYCRDNIKFDLRVSSRLQLKAMRMLRVFLVQRFFETLQYCDGGTKIQPSHTYIRTYMRSCEKKLTDQLDPLIYYGISKGVMKPPRGQSSGN